MGALGWRRCAIDIMRRVRNRDKSELRDRSYGRDIMRESRMRNSPPWVAEYNPRA
jgi:hypothetical protein